MTVRSLLAVAAAGLLVASPMAAFAATTSKPKPATSAHVDPCKGLHGDKLKTCRATHKK